MPERIAKFMARAGLCSRREAERWIEEGRVTLNNKILKTPATNVTPDDIITVDGKQVSDKKPTELWLYHKPTGLITTHKDPEGRPTVFDHLPKTLPRVISVGRLDLNSEGLLLLTNNGNLSRHLEHPSTGWKRKYRVRIYGKPSEANLNKLRDGITIENIQYRPVQIEKEQETKSHTWLNITLSEGKNREIRKLFEHIGHPVTRLIRTSYGPFQLGKLASGEIKKIPNSTLKTQLRKEWL